MKKNRVSFWVRLAVIPALSVVLLAGCSPAMRADLETGKQARRAGDYQTAVKNLTPLAEFGIPEAQYELALALLKNKNATVADKRQARELLMAQAKAGNTQASYELGRYYRDQKDYDNAITYYMYAAEAGDMKAYFELGSIEEKKKNPKTALALYKKAYEGHYYRAASRIARIYEKGVDGSPDEAEALRWYEIAREKGDSDVEEKIESLKSSSSVE